MENIEIKKIFNDTQNLRYFYILSTFYIFIILTSMTVSARLVPIQIPFFKYHVLITGGTWTIPIAFFIQDISTEVYGSSKSKEIVFLSIPIVIFYVLYLKITTLMPLHHDKSSLSEAYNLIFNSIPRHLIAFLLAIGIGVFVNNFVLSKLKILFHGKYMIFRFITSTAVGEAALQFIGTVIAWGGTLNFQKEIIPFVIFSYSYKIIFEFLSSPICYLICIKLKNIEGIDIYEE